MGEFYDDTTLKDLGFVIHLGHGGSHCPCGDRQDNFVVVDVSGIHTVDITYCGCYQADGSTSHHRLQLLRFGWFPATVTRPRTAFTYDTLDSFHLLTLQGKTSAYDFYYSLVHKFDNTGLLNVKVSLTTIRYTLLHISFTGSVQAILDGHSNLATPEGAEAHWAGS